MLGGRKLEEPLFPQQQRHEGTSGILVVPLEPFCSSSPTHGRVTGPVGSHRLPNTFVTNPLY